MKFLDKMRNIKNAKSLTLDEMVWQGVILKESLEDVSLLTLAKLGKKTKTRLEGEKRIMTFYNVEVENSKVKEYLDLAMKSIRPSFYTHLCRDGEMYVAFRGKLFNFKANDPTLEKAREYGKSMGILPEQMEFEYLIKHPYGRSLLSLITNKIISYFQKYFSQSTTRRN